MKRKRARRFYSWHCFLEIKWLLAVIAIAVVFLGLSFTREALRNWEFQKEVGALQSQVDELEMKNLKLLELRAVFGTESFLEREARLKLGLKKPGEEVIVVQYPDDNPEPSDTEHPLEVLLSEADHPKNFSNPQKWWMYLFEPERFARVKSYVP